LTSIKHAGIPWELGLSEAHQTLMLNHLRGRVRLQTDGQLKTGRDVAIAALLGAEEHGFATMPLIAIGCIMMRKCHTGRCPVGVATQDPLLRAKFTGQPEHVINFFFLMAEEIRTHLANLGFKSMDEAIGRTELLEMDTSALHDKNAGLDLTSVLTAAGSLNPDAGIKHAMFQDHGIANSLDRTLIEKSKPSLEDGVPLV
jgi:glutamate synthase (NADPH/NADH) large chain